MMSLFLNKKVENSCMGTAKVNNIDVIYIGSSKFSVFELAEIVIFCVYYTIPFGLSLIRHFWGITFQLLELLCLAIRITDEGSVPEMRIWSILLINPIENGVYI